MMTFASAVDAQEPDRVAVRLFDDASATVHLVVDEHLDLGVRTARLEGDAASPRVPLGPAVVVGQGEDRTNLTVVRVLNRHQVLEAQFLAFDASVRGGVRVSAGRDGAGETRLVATPAAPQQKPVFRVFNRVGGLQREVEPEGLGRGSLHVRIADFFPDRPGDEVAAVAADEQPVRVAWFGLDGNPLGLVELDLPAGQEVSVSRAGAGRLRVHAKPSHRVLLVAPGGEPECETLDSLPPDARVWPSRFGPRKLIAGVDDPLRSRLLRLQPGGGSNTLDVGHLENQFWVAPKRWAPGSANERHRGRDAYVRVADHYGHFRMDTGSPGFAEPGLWDEPGVWPRIAAASEAKWAPLLRPLAQQPLRLWEPTITHRMNRPRADPWAQRTDPVSGRPRFLSLDRDDRSTGYGEFGRKDQFHVFTYAYGDTALDQLYRVPLQQFLLRLAEPFRGDPERMISLEPVHEHEVSVGAAGSVGDYHPLMVAGFHAHLNRLYGDDASLGRVFGLPDGPFDAPRNKGRGPWDRYDEQNPFYAQWILYQRHVVNRRIADAYTAALAAGFPPELIKGHQIPDTFAVGSTETFSDRKSRFTPVDYTLQAGVGFGYTRYGVWFRKDQNMLKSAATSGFQSVVLGEYQALTLDARLAAEQLDFLFENGVTAVHAMDWPKTADPSGGFNASMEAAVRGMLQDQRPRPGLAGGVGRNLPMTDRNADVAVIGTGSTRTGLLKSLDGYGRWEGSVYCVPFRSRIDPLRLRSRIDRRPDGRERHRFALDPFDGAMQAEVTLRGSGTGEVAVSVERGGEALPGLAAAVPAGPQPRSFRFVLRNQLPADGLELVIDLPAGFEAADRPESLLMVDRVARPHRGQMEGSAHRGSVDFDLLPARALN